MLSGFWDTYKEIVVNVNHLSAGLYIYKCRITSTNSLEITEKITSIVELNVFLLPVIENFPDFEIYESDIGNDIF